MAKELPLLDRIRSLQTTINKRTQERSRLEGQRDELLKRLDTEFKCKTLQEAAEKAESLQSEIAEVDSNLQGVEHRLGELQKAMEA